MVKLKLVMVWLLAGWLLTGCSLDPFATKKTTPQDKINGGLFYSTDGGASWSGYLFYRDSSNASERAWVGSGG